MINGECLMINEITFAKSLITNHQSLITNH